ncbi:tolB protein precursor [Minicystis rosea]|nr:tolB protein precursor [Minicystis rosea]
MRISPSIAFGSLALIVAAVLPVACGGGGTNSTSNTTQGGGGSGAGTTSSTASGDGGGLIIGNDPVESITISPADPSVEVLNGTIPAATVFTATGLTKGGKMVVLSGGTWTFDRPDAATLNTATGALTATGLTGGKGTVTYKLDGVTATTTATVKLHITSDPQNIDPSVKQQLGQASAPDGAMSLLYPYDKTVFPRGLTGPTLQWNGGASNDIYYIHATSPTFEYEAWTTVPPPSRYDFPKTPIDVWKKLTDSTTGDITISIQRHDGAQPYLPVARTWTIAPANLTGIIYFWEVNSGAVVRLKPGDTAPEAFLNLNQVPPNPDPSAGTCTACHSVSKNGKTIVTAFNGSASPWGTFDAATGNSIFTYGVNPNDGANGSGFQAISPNGSHVLWGQSRGTPYLSLSPFDSGAEIAQLNPGAGWPVMPAWSSDGKQIAFAVRSDGGWLDFNTAALWTTDVDLAGPSFANTHPIVSGDANRPCIIYPTYSPDSKWIAFERSTQARSRGALADIWLTSADGATQIALDRANGAGLLQGTEVSSTYEPTFMPVAAGGYFWLVVVGERTYGNTLTDLNPASRHKQLWVSAIDASPLPGQDPSHPAFWLPGQELNNNNMRGEWALSPCKMLGDSCSAGYDCCAGFCHDDGMGNLTCSDQSGGCSQIGEACKAASDCCDPKATCIGGFCANNGPN